MRDADYFQTICMLARSVAAGCAYYPRIRRPYMWETEALRDYTSEDRWYHGTKHIYTCLYDLFQADYSYQRETTTAFWALLFHDVVYDTTRTDNEERSADAAYHLLTELGIQSTEQAEEVRSCILATKHGSLNPGRPLRTSAKLTCDIDLISLANPNFMRVLVGDIRLEWPHLTDEEFYLGNREFLSKLLERPSIYQLSHYQNLYEDRARKNIERWVNASSWQVEVQRVRDMV